MSSVVIKWLVWNTGLALVGPVTIDLIGFVGKIHLPTFDASDKR